MMTRLGMSDLTEEQAFAVSIYRDWLAHSDRFACFEEDVSGALLHDPLFEVLHIIFTTFRYVTSDRFAPSGNGDLLSPQEEQLLDALAERLCKSDSCSSLKEGAVRSGAFPRVGEISRSGADDTQAMINAASWRIFSSSIGLA